MKEFNWLGFKNRDFGVKCNSEDEAVDFIRVAYKHGFKWNGTDSSVTHFKFCENYTVYYGENGHLTYWIDGYDEETIIEWSDYMSKELNIIEASKMPKTEFEVLFANGSKEKMFTSANGNIYYMDGNSINLRWDVIQAKFIPLPKPVSFTEAVTSGSRIRVDISSLEGFDEMDIDSLNEYHYLNELFDTLGSFMNCTIREIIEKGKWYIED